MAPNNTQQEEASKGGNSSPEAYLPYSGDIAIAGISGRYPESDSVGEFRDNLFGKVNMLTCDDRRWKLGHLDLPDVLGKLRSVDRFDSEFFNLNSKQTEMLDPQTRLLLEVCYEAIVDAGESLASVKGSRTGMYLAISSSEPEQAWICRQDPYIVMGCPHTMSPNRISFFFDLHGPSIAYDTACSSVLVALEAAFQHMRTGVIDSAIVAGVNTCFRALTSKVYQNMGMLGPEACKAFDSSGNGYARSEIVSALFLKKSSDSKRIYCSVVNVKTNNDGFTPQGLTFPSGEIQEQLMRNVYADCKLNPKEVSYFECHGTGTPAGDPQETNAIYRVMCTPDKREPLLIGSVKSNMGHAETGSAMASITKVILAMHEGFIAPNLHFRSPNPKIEGLRDGKMAVVTEATPWSGGYMAINSFGMGGSNAHAVLRSYDVSSSKPHPSAHKPRLFTYSARTEHGLRAILREAQTHAASMEFHALCQASADAPLGSMPYRGATILNGQHDFEVVEKCKSKAREVWFIYAGMGSQWVGMARCLMQLDVFRHSLEKSAAVLKPHGVDLLNILSEGTEDTLRTILNPFVCITSIQVALTDLLWSMGIRPDGIVGHSMGEVGCAYCDGCLTAEEAVLTAYWRGKCVTDGKVPPGKMAAVGLTWEEAKSQCPAGVVPACHNAEDSVTISGAADVMLKFMEELKAKDVFVREVNSSNIAYHSYFMENIYASLKDSLSKVISPKPRTARWLPTSVPEELWDSAPAQSSSAEFHANNLVSPVLFHEALQKIPPTAIAIELAPHGLLQSVIKRTLGNESVCVGLQKRNYADNLEFLFASLGKCFANGLSLNPLACYPPVEFPVPKGTPRLSDMVAGAWDHSAQWLVPKNEDFEGRVQASGSDSSYSIDVSADSPDRYLLDHQVDGRELFPACGCLVLAWKTLAALNGRDFEQMPVRLSRVEIHQAMFLPKSGSATVTVSVMPRTGEFQVCENENLLASGFVTCPDKDVLETSTHAQTRSSLQDRPATEVLTRDEVYRELILRGYEYGPYFQGILRASVDGQESEITWDGRWVSFMDSVLQMDILARPGDYQMLPIKFQSINIDPRVQPAAPAEDEDVVVLPGRFDPVLDIVSAGGVEIRGLETISASRRLTHAPEVVEEYRFVPHHVTGRDDPGAKRPGATVDIREYADACLAFAVQGIKKWLSEDKDKVLPQKDLLQDALGLANQDLGSKSSSSDFISAKAALERILKQQNGHQQHGFGLFHTLNLAFSEPLEIGFRETLKNKIHHMRYDMWDDCLMSAVECADSLKLCIDTVAENTTSHIVNVLEAGAAKGAFYRRAIPEALAKFSGKDYRYTVGDASPMDDAKEFSVKTLQFDAYDPANFPASQAHAHDLLVLKWVLHQQEDLDAAMAGFCGFVRPGGFILVQEFVHRLPTLLAVEAVTDHPLPRKSGDRVLGRYYSAAQWRELFRRHGLVEVIHRSDGALADMFLLRSRVEVMTPPTVLHLDDLSCSWLEEVKAKYSDLEAMPQDARLWLVGKSDCNGMLGFFNCLRQEPGSERVRCVQVCGDSVPDLSPGSAEFKYLAEMDLAFNVHKDGKWGVYRHLAITDDQRRQQFPTEHAFVDTLTSGDLSTLTWVRSPLNLHASSEKGQDCELCTVYMAGVVSRDLALACGKLRRDELPAGMFCKEGTLGIEFSGRDTKGKRVMGLCAPPALASSVLCLRSSLWSVPQHWSLEEAATVPVAYSTAYYALVIRGHVRPGDTVLVHAGGSPVGQAAIAVAQSCGCEIFISTATDAETSSLKSMFPRLKDRNFCSCKDASFERHVKKETSGKGVDIILNCTTGELLGASIRLLASRGRFLNLASGRGSDAELVFSGSGRRDTSFHDINLDTLIDAQGPEWTELTSLVQKGIQSGLVKPLARTVYAMDRLVDVFKLLEEGAQAGKLLVKIREEEAEKITLPAKKTFEAVPRTFFHPAKSYVIVGGLGGFGLELAHWMVLRGVRKLVLTSRNGITTGYQTRKIAFLRSLGADIVVCAVNVTSQAAADRLVKTATDLGPLGGVFNLGLNLRDALLVEQTAENYKQTLEAKIQTTSLLDGISRSPKIQPTLDHFVMFSSLSAGHGIPGQTNYGWGNSYMDRLCEKRRAQGLPGLSIQWASIADVGFVGTKGNNVVIEGKWPQRMYNCLQVCDYFLSQNRPVVACHVLAEKVKAAVEGEETVGQQVIKAVGNVLGLKSVSGVDPDKVFLDLGLDSLMSVEIKQMLERDLDLALGTKDIQMLTFAQLQAMVQ
nr:fatty acid synthase [synthetic construct]